MFKIASCCDWKILIPSTEREREKKIIYFLLLSILLQSLNAFKKKCDITNAKKPNNLMCFFLIRFVCCWTMESQVSWMMSHIYFTWHCEKKVWKINNFSLSNDENLSSDFCIMTYFCIQEDLRYLKNNFPSSWLDAFELSKKCRPISMPFTTGIYP